MCFADFPEIPLGSLNTRKNNLSLHIVTKNYFAQCFVKKLVCAMIFTTTNVQNYIRRYYHS